MLFYIYYLLGDVYFVYNIFLLVFFGPPIVKLFKQTDDGLHLFVHSPISRTTFTHYLCMHSRFNVARLIGYFDLSQLPTMYILMIYL